MKEMTTVNMGNGANPRDDSVNIASAVSGETISGSEAFAATASTESNKTWINDSTNKGNAMVGGLAKTLLRVKRKVEIFFEEMVDNIDITKKLSTFGGGNNNEKVVNVATVVMIAELVNDEAIELIE